MADSSTLTLAVVGHTNTGKTSLLRTLTRNPSFGEISDQPGTTRHVEGARLLVAGQVAIQLYDTPGMEDSMALLDYMDQLAQRAHRLDGPERIQRFLESPESKKRFEQEARVLNKLRTCDAGLYVVDVRDPVLSKHKDELALLASCARPLLPVLNFTHSTGQRSDEWRQALANLGLHASVEFDTVAPALDGEDQLYGKLALLMDNHASLLANLQTDIHQQRQTRHQDALRLVAELLVDAAAFHLSCAPDGDAVQNATNDLREKIRQREAACVKKLLACYNFRAADFGQHALPLKGERWGMDLFHPQALKDAGIEVSKGVVAGAAAGVTVDIFTAGLSMGAAALTGAIAGGLWQGMEHLGKRVVGRLRGYRELSVDDAVLQLLEVRQMRLIQALEVRGHAAQTPIALHDDNNTAPTSSIQKSSDLHEELAQARSQPQWSTLARHFEPGPKREQTIRELAAKMS